MCVKRSSICSFFESILAILIILECETIWKFSYSETIRNTYIIIVNLMICIISFFLWSICVNKCKKIDRNKLYSISNIIIYFFVLFLINYFKGSWKNTALFILPFLALFFYLNKSKRILFLFDKIYNILVIIGAFSIICFMLFSIFHVVDAPSTFVITRNNHSVVVPSYYFYYMPQKIESIFRNTAFFYEGPKYNLLLTIALAYDLFIKNNFITKKNVILYITILTVISTTGILVATFMIIYKYLISLKRMEREKVIIIFVGGFLLMLLISIYAIDNFQYKMTTLSYSHRLNDYIIGFKAWRECPFLGTGIGNNFMLDKYTLMYRNQVGFSNGIFRILSQGGYYLFLLLIVPLSLYIKKCYKKRNISYFMFSVIFIVLLMVTSFSNNVIYFLCIIWFVLYSNDTNSVII